MAVGRRRNNDFDPDEIESEERERRQRKAHDREFKEFGLKMAEKVCACAGASTELATDLFGRV